MDKRFVYLDFNALKTLAQGNTKSMSSNPMEEKSMQEIWHTFKDEKIALVTSQKDMEMELISWFNHQGCCITDMLTPMEAIEEFERWELSDKDQTRYWRRILFYFEQIDILPETYHEQGGLLEEIISLLEQSHINGYPSNNLSLNENDTREILRECIRVFEYVFPEKNWHDLRHVDYSINWKVMELALKNLHIELELSGEKGIKNMRLFGLLNRLIGLCKKSSKNLPLDKGHGEFIINMVLKKYYQPLEKSYIKHIYSCLIHHINLYLTTDYNLIERFHKAKEYHSEKTVALFKTLDIVTPTKLKTKVLDGM